MWLLGKCLLVKEVHAASYTSLVQWNWLARCRVLCWQLIAWGKAVVASPATLQRAMGEFGAVSVISGNIIGQTQTMTL